jgi:hypothetical protein
VVECPVDGCDYTGEKGSVVAHASGKRDEAHTGIGYQKARQLLDLDDSGPADASDPDESPPDDEGDTDPSPDTEPVTDDTETSAAVRHDGGDPVGNFDAELGRQPPAVTPTPDEPTKGSDGGDTDETPAETGESGGTGGGIVVLGLVGGVVLAVVAGALGGSNGQEQQPGFRGPMPPQGGMRR